MKWSNACMSHCVAKCRWHEFPFSPACPCHMLCNSSSLELSSASMVSSQTLHWLWSTCQISHKGIAAAHSNCTSMLVVLDILTSKSPPLLPCITGLIQQGVVSGLKVCVSVSVCNARGPTCWVGEGSGRGGAAALHPFRWSEFCLCLLAYRPAVQLHLVTIYFLWPEQPCEGVLA